MSKKTEKTVTQNAAAETKHSHHTKLAEERDALNSSIQDLINSTK